MSVTDEFNLKKMPVFGLAEPKWVYLPAEANARHEVDGVSVTVHWVCDMWVNCQHFESSEPLWFAATDHVLERYRFLDVKEAYDRRQVPTG